MATGSLGGQHGNQNVATTAAPQDHRPDFRVVPGVPSVSRWSTKRRAFAGPSVVGWLRAGDGDRTGVVEAAPMLHGRTGRLIPLSSTEGSKRGPTASSPILNIPINPLDRHHQYPRNEIEAIDSFLHCADSWRHVVGEQLRRTSKRGSRGLRAVRVPGRNTRPDHGAVGEPTTTSTPGPAWPSSSRNSWLPSSLVDPQADVSPRSWRAELPGKSHHGDHRRRSGPSGTALMLWRGRHSGHHEPCSKGPRWPTCSAVTTSVRSSIRVAPVYTGLGISGTTTATWMPWSNTTFTGPDCAHREPSTNGWRIPRRTRRASRSGEIGRTLQTALAGIIVASTRSRPAVRCAWVPCASQADSIPTIVQAISDLWRATRPSSPGLRSYEDGIANVPTRNNVDNSNKLWKSSSFWDFKSHPLGRSRQYRRQPELVGLSVSTNWEVPRLEPRILHTDESTVDTLSTSTGIVIGGVDW